MGCSDVGFQSGAVPRGAWPAETGQQSTGSARLNAIWPARPGERPLAGVATGGCRPKPDIRLARLSAWKLTVVLSSSGWPLWVLERTFLWRSMPSYTNPDRSRPGRRQPTRCCRSTSQIEHPQPVIRIGLRIWLWSIGVIRGPGTNSVEAMCPSGKFA